MISEEKIKANESRFKRILWKSNKKGIDRLIKFLENNVFFTAQASKNYHCNYKGGLCEHSLSVYDTVRAMSKIRPTVNSLKGTDKNNTSLALGILLHDVCKVVEGPYHGKKSMRTVLKFIKLTEFEKNIILYHMGHYGINLGDYSLFDYNRVGNDNPYIKLVHWADDFSSQFLEKVKR